MFWRWAGTSTFLLSLRMEAAWDQALGTFLDYCKDQVQSLRNVTQQYYKLEGHKLPPGIVDIIIAGCDPADLLLHQPSNAPRLAKACAAWSIPVSKCVFLLDLRHHSRRFFEALVRLSALCPDWQEASRLLLDQAGRRRQGSTRQRRGVSRIACALVVDDVKTVLHNVTERRRQDGPRPDDCAPAMARHRSNHRTRTGESPAPDVQTLQGSLSDRPDNANERATGANDTGDEETGENDTGEKDGDDGEEDDDEEEEDDEEENEEGDDQQSDDEGVGDKSPGPVEQGLHAKVPVRFLVSLVLLMGG
ncbi:hypothetical protein Ct61P_15081 [Colletotrichum tofieldiae]|nr:hypothetical protein Ct61P_15081 [Colletotrichum tofieldiae]